MASPSVPRRRLPLELQVQIISYLSVEDQICAAEVSQTWCRIIADSQSMRRSRYSTGRAARGIHCLISTKSECFRCDVIDTSFREYYFQRNRLRNDNPFLDEPFFSPTAWNGEDPELADWINRMEFDLFTSVPGLPQLTWRGTEYWGENITVRKFMEAMLKPVLEAEGRVAANGSLTFFIANYTIASAYRIDFSGRSSGNG
ncbi:hypothetical protein TWF106_002149 [Orbilia oligospora]|uniref:F-box domain-containing protein n=1 Tax=Orbilia oligospora TaxID=2813651 RepID=A0A6G1M1P3_ORBOL|nr:hypothetical protein TWF788_001363 [Orbilia oligospora]KAF3219423.1 hypothetical protein TWF679_010894 [Orbilia oligospora]KAF3225631.1 hypothetical protein TWF106_002149 [Orbilia oligospora]KAF3226229.1 hypothetical protein TWF191_004890 [Orbilia oligospora]KAF3241834.1 hypothetical protein TWF192_008847 [Orbilia oligospora]